jgi:hypothetical protein
MAVGAMSAFMDELVAGARSSRDAAFNTLDAIERQTRAASNELARRIEKVIAENPATKKAALVAPDPASGVQQAREDSRDARFDPEDEWDVAGPDTAGAPSPPAATRATDDEDDYPQTWLR